MTLANGAHEFTGKERDSEWGLDNSMVRYYGSSLGRFMSPDPSGMDLANPLDPQQLNLYAYARNNPLTFTDPYGLDCAYLNNAGNRLTRTPQPTGTGSTFGYDNIYELLSVTQGSSTTESYTYDPVGNRLTSLGSAAWSYNTSNELNSRPSLSYSYDANGNTTSKTDSTGTTTYTWGYENRLTSVTLPGSGGTVSYRYDPFGRRIYKSSSSGTSIYAYDLDNLIEEANSSGAAVARYAQGTMIDEPLVMLRSGTSSYYEADGLGTISSLTNVSGSLVQTYTFDSFGNQTASSGTLTNSFQYSGREFDSEATLYYMRARYFDPKTGRFLNEDPVRFLGGSNFYRYAINNPTGFIDPFGWCPPTRNQRLKAAAQGLGNILLGSVKVAGGLALTAETGGLAAPVAGELLRESRFYR